jgi:hypothetical protein
MLALYKSFITPFIANNAFTRIVRRGDNRPLLLLLRYWLLLLTDY